MGASLPVRGDAYSRRCCRKSKQFSWSIKIVTGPTLYAYTSARSLTCPSKLLSIATWTHTAPSFKFVVETFHLPPGTAEMTTSLILKIVDIGMSVGVAWDGYG